MSDANECARFHCGPIDIVVLAHAGGHRVITSDPGSGAVLDVFPVSDMKLPEIIRHVGRIYSELVTGGAASAQPPEVSTGDRGERRADELGRVLTLGARCLHDLLERGPLSPPDWFRTMQNVEGLRAMVGRIDDRQQREVDERADTLHGISEDTLAWVWDSLVSNPHWGDEVRRQIRWGDGERDGIELFPPGTELVALFKPFSTTSGERTTQQDTRNQCALIRLRDTLRMQRGKRGRLECASVECELWVFIPPHLDPERAKERLRPKDGVESVRTFQVEVPGGERGQYRSGVRAVAGSLNQAYSMASGVLETDRRSHGGRIYEHVVWLGHDSCVGLDSIRNALERWGLTPTQALHRLSSREINAPDLRPLRRAAAEHSRMPTPPGASMTAPPTSANVPPPTTVPMKSPLSDIRTDDIKAGDVVRLRNGRIVQVVDSRRGISRRVRSEGPHGAEVGDMYAWEFAELRRGDGTWQPIVLTEDQIAHWKRSQLLGA